MASATVCVDGAVVVSLREGVAERQAVFVCRGLNGSFLVRCVGQGEKAAAETAKRRP